MSDFPNDIWEKILVAVIVWFITRPLSLLKRSHVEVIARLFRKRKIDRRDPFADYNTLPPNWRDGVSDSATIEIYAPHV